MWRRNPLRNRKNPRILVRNPRRSKTQEKVDPAKAVTHARAQVLFKVGQRVLPNETEENLLPMHKRDLQLEAKIMHHWSFHPKSKLIRKVMEKWSSFNLWSCKRRNRAKRKEPIVNRTSQRRRRAIEMWPADTGMGSMSWTPRTIRNRTKEKE